MATRRGASPYRGPADPELRREWRSARHVVARRHHPDLGGDGDVLCQELMRVDRYFASRDRVAELGNDAAWLTAPAPRWQPATRALRRSARRLRRTGRAFRARLPRNLPGSRRYIDL